jgi:hypothetical protein
MRLVPALQESLLIPRQINTRLIRHGIASS